MLSLFSLGWLTGRLHFQDLFHHGVHGIVQHGDRGLDDGFEGRHIAMQNHSQKSGAQIGQSNI